MKWIHRVSKESGRYYNFSPGLPLTSVHFHYNLRHRKSQKKIGTLAIVGLTALSGHELPQRTTIRRTPRATKIVPAMRSSQRPALSLRLIQRPTAPEK